MFEGVEHHVTEFRWTLLIVFGFPLLTVVLIELSRRFALPGSPLRRPMRLLQAIVLPAGVLWIIVHQLLHLPPDGLMVKVVDTAVGILLLHAVFTSLQSLIVAFSEQVNRLPAPRLFYELASSAIVAVGAAIIVSTIWDVDLGSLLGALGIGSVVLGLALQNVIGGLVAGVIVFSGRHFGLGDWLTIDDAPAKVVQIDWRAITVETLSGQRVVIPSANMSGQSMRIIRARQPVGVQAKVLLPLTAAPDAAKQALRQAALDVPQLVDPARLSCRISEAGADGMLYNVSFLVADATQVSAARDVFFHRLWYVGQRHGLAIGGGDHDHEQLYGADTPQLRAEALAASGAFGPASEGLLELASAARLQVYAAGESILRAGAVAPGFLMFLSGEARVVLPAGGSALVEHLSAGDLYATRDMFRGAAAQARVVAESDVRLLLMPVAAMERLLEGAPALARAVDLVVEAHSAALSESLAAGRGA
ncbi:membrane protein [Azorhizobium oxalatiphilum]|uniref:Membrane protein n=1 Tax=Azorhizobium oxalatiphilum TaxID=980631 RepID=A0A917CHA8_9HYPH|nr:cyclic nucleotide-binding domain-containing protein [Azorhizobium oxalatiphilum]GGF88450.1 membrane protein [Azorhizobium oxalatiphilum]